MQRRALVGKGAGPTPIADGSDDVMEGGSSGTSTSTSTRLSIGETPSSLGNSAPFQPPSADTKGSANRRRGNSMLTMFGRGDSDAAIDEINAKSALEQSMRLQMMSRPTESCLHVVNILQLQVPGSPSYSWGDKQSSSSSSIGMGIDAFKAVPITPSPPSAADALAVLSLDDDDDGGDDDDEKTTGTSTGSGTSTGAGTGNSGVDSSNEGGDTPDSNSSRDGGETHIYVHNSTGLMSLARPAGLEYICTPVDVTNVQTNASTADAAVSGSAQKDKEGEKEGDCSVIVLVSLSEINKGTLKERGGVQAVIESTLPSLKTHWLQLWPHVLRSSTETRSPSCLLASLSLHLIILIILIILWVLWEEFLHLREILRESRVSLPHQLVV